MRQGPAGPRRVLWRPPQESTAQRDDEPRQHDQATPVMTAEVHTLMNDSRATRARGAVMAQIGTAS
jgi:hypothetical protein